MPDPIEVTRDAPAMPQAPVDPNVRLPEGARRAAEAADAIHKQAYQTPAPAPEPAPAPAPAAAAPAPEPAPAPAHEPAPAPAAEPTREDFTAAPDLQRKYDALVASMNGRLKQKDAVITSQNEQLEAMGQELQRVTVALESRGNVPQPATPTQLTDADREFAGDQLIDIVRKVATEAVAPVQQQLQTTQKVSAVNAKAQFYAYLDAQIPEWRALNRDPEFLGWLRLPDVYAGRVRQALLTEAVKSTDGPRALQFFKGFMSEAGRTPSPQPTPEPQPAPRQAATTLEALAAPGRAKPAGGTTPAATPAANEPTIYTRQDISNFYAHKRLFLQNKGLYAGNKAEMDRVEHDIVRAQTENRVRG